MLGATHRLLVRIPKHLKPPKRAPGPYFLFYASFVKSQPQGSTLQEFQELSKRAGEIWRGYSMAEKQVCIVCRTDFCSSTIPSLAIL